MKISKFLKKILNILPSGVRNKIRALYNRAMYKRIILRWEKTGKKMPPPHQVKQATIDKYRVASGYKILVETGTYLGDMIEAKRKQFDKIFQLNLALNYGHQPLKDLKNTSTSKSFKEIVVLS